ncbi:MAG TPA: Uma2 family endonuclease, partial [Chthonomonadaceae bacterium]|nr:Uma2 family endonuclease [Chthonomonadaceae bacterium]
KMGQGSLHAYVIVRLTAWMLALFGPDFVRFQLPFRVTGEDRNGSEPEPDAVALTRPAADFLTENPDATFVTLVVEASDSSLQFDRVKKSALYARNGVPEYWVIDIEGRQIIAHRQPSAGGYEEILAYSADELIATLARPDAPVAVAALLPPLAAG